MSGQHDAVLGGTSPLARSFGAWLGGRDLAAGGPPWLAAARAHSAAVFLENGLPGNKDEAWKYTSLRRLEELAPAVREPAGIGAVPDWRGPLPSVRGFGFRWLDGCVAFAPGAIPAGVQVLGLDEALHDNQLAARLRSLFESFDVAGRGRAFEALNLALPSAGIVIRVAAGVDAGTCSALWGLPSRTGSGFHNARLYVVLEDGARLRLIEQHRPPESAGGELPEARAQALNLVLQADLGTGAVLEHLRVQDDARDGVLLTSTEVRQAAASRYVCSAFDVGGGLVRHALSCRLAGPEAQAIVRGAFVVDAERHVDHHVSIDHQAPGGSSEQLFRGVLGGHARGVYNGKAVIRPGADGSRVRQSNANLLLSRDAEMDTKPELEIYADEVEASHGATVGQLDESAVFYLKSRGISDADARLMLTTAFCRVVADRLEDRGLAEAIAALIERAMPASTMGSE